MNEAKKFINSGYLDFKNLLNKDLCKKLNHDISKIRGINKNTFLSRRDYLIKQKKNTKNILDNFNLDFIFKNEFFLKKIKFILGEDFELYAKRMICGVPHKFFGEEIIAFVEKKDSSLEKSDVVDVLTENLQPLKRPNRIIFVDKMPIGPSGKILKRKLREELNVSK